MRSFIILCLVAVACADKLGYDYQPVGHSDAGLSFGPGGGSAVGSDGGLGGGDAGGLGGGFIGGGGGGSIGDGGGSGASDGSYDGGVGSYGGPSSGELEKEYYTFSAPEGDFDDGDTNNQVANSLKKGLRVVFIKGPENRGLEDAALALAKQAADQRTSIYVLNKQADISSLAQQFNALRNDRNNKPDVHFVKYRTPEDAANAQQQIQSQYDGLGGSSRSHDGGVAPVLNFASQAPIASRGSYDVGSVPAAPSVNYIPASPSASYLPASLFRSLRF